MYSAFISFAHGGQVDREFAAQLTGALERLGVAVWAELEGAPLTADAVADSLVNDVASAAADWEAEVEKAIQQTQLFVFLLSAAAAASRWTLDELERAIKADAPVVIIELEAVDQAALPSALRSLLEERGELTLKRANFANAEELARLLLALLNVTQDSAGLASFFTLGLLMTDPFRSPESKGSHVTPALPASPAPALRLGRRPLIPLAGLVALALVIVAVGVVALAQWRIWPPLFSFSPGARATLLYTLSAAGGALGLTLAGVAAWRGYQAISARRTGSGAQRGNRRGSGAVFISYKRTGDESAFVDRLDGDLLAEGFATWVDRRALVPGREWDPEIRRAIDVCHLLLVVMSPFAVESKWVRKEYQRALRRRKVVIPVYFYPCARVPRELERLQSVDLIAGLRYKAKYRLGLRQLIGALREHGVPQTEAAA